MGAQQSLALANEIHLACSSGKDGLADLLQDTAFNDRWTAILSSTTDEIRTSFTGLTRQPRKNRLFTKIATCEDALELPTCIADSLQDWERDPKTFFSGIGLGDVVSLYEYIEALDRNPALDALRRRVTLTTLYRLKTRTGCHGLADYIARSGRVKDALKEITDKCSRWSEVGKRYDGYAKHFTNDGAIFALDFKMKSIWEIHLPADGVERRDLLERQEKRSIMSIADLCKPAADRIFGYLGQMMDQWCVQTPATDFHCDKLPPSTNKRKRGQGKPMNRRTKSKLSTSTKIVGSATSTGCDRVLDQQGTCRYTIEDTDLSRGHAEHHNNEIAPGDAVLGIPSTPRPLSGDLYSNNRNGGQVSQPISASRNGTDQWRENCHGASMDGSTNPFYSNFQGNKAIEINVGSPSLSLQVPVPFDTLGESEQFRDSWFNLDDDDTLGNAVRLAWDDLPQLS